jgi:fibronectin-binding autotransporter adhesin
MNALKRVLSTLVLLCVAALLGYIALLSAPLALGQVSGLTWKGPVTAGHCTQWLKPGVVEDAGVSGCGSGGSALPTCTLDQMIYYAAAGDVGSCLTLGTNLSISGGTLNASGGGSSAFSALTSGTNTTAAMLVGTGASLGATGSGTITATSTPLAGLTGLGTSVAGALATNVGSAGAFIVFGGAAGEPSSINLANATFPASISAITTLSGLTSANGSTVPASAGALAGSTGTFTLNDCLKVGSTSPLEIEDNGSACGSGGGMVYPGAGIPVSTGSAWSTSITPGTGVETALGVSVGSSGAFVVLGGAGGTPSSINLANATFPASISAITTLSGLTSANGSTVPASAGTLAGSTGSFTIGHCLEVGSTSPLEIEDNGSACGTGGSTAFSALTGSTNTTAAMLVGSGASLGPTGTGTLNSNEVNGATVPASASCLASNSSSQLIACTTTTTLPFSDITAGANTAALTMGTGGSLHYSSGIIDANYLLTDALPALSTGYLEWTGSAWAFATPSGGGNVSTSGTITSGTLALWASSTAIQTLANGANGTVLAMVSGSPAWTSGILSASGTPTQYQTAVFPNATSVEGVGPGTSGQCFMSNGAGAYPSYQTCPSGGLSGMTSGQVPIAASASTVTSSKALAGSGAGITTGPTSSTSGDVVTYTGTAGQTQDSGTPLTSLVTALASGSQALGTSAIASGACATTIQVAVTGGTTSDTATLTPTTDPNTVTGYKASASGALYVNSFMTSGELNIEVCNNTGSSITPSALSVHYLVTSP